MERMLNDDLVSLGRTRTYTSRMPEPLLLVDLCRSTGTEIVILDNVRPTVPVQLSVVLTFNSF